MKVKSFNQKFIFNTFFHIFNNEITCILQFNKSAIPWKYSHDIFCLSFIIKIQCNSCRYTFTYITLTLLRRHFAEMVYQIQVLVSCRQLQMASLASHITRSAY